MVMGGVDIRFRMRYTREIEQVGPIFRLCIHFTTDFAPVAQGTEQRIPNP